MKCCKYSLGSNPRPSAHSHELNYDTTTFRSHFSTTVLFSWILVDRDTSQDNQLFLHEFAFYHFVLSCVLYVLLNLIKFLTLRLSLWNPKLFEHQISRELLVLSPELLHCFHVVIWILFVSTTFLSHQLVVVVTLFFFTSFLFLLLCSMLRRSCLEII